MKGKKFDWLYLIVAVVAMTAFASANERWGKWIFGLVIVSALLLASDTMLERVREGVGIK